MFNNEFGVSNESLLKTSVKWLEIPIEKFNAAVNHFVESFRVHQNNIKKLKSLDQWEEMQKEHLSASRIVGQLTSLLNEMENLRYKVVETDLNKFDRLISNSKQKALVTIQSHQDIPVRHFHANSENHDSNLNEEAKYKKHQAFADLTEDIQRHEQNAASVEKLHQDVEDINSLFQELSQLVHDQGESVEKVEEHVEIAHNNVLEGESMLCQAAKYKSGMYPLVGALIGSVVGGPIGLLAGFKLGGLTAVGCGFLGFTGGKFLKHQDDVTISEAECHRKDLAS